MWTILRCVMIMTTCFLSMKCQMALKKLCSDKAMLCYLEPLVTYMYCLACVADMRIKKMTDQVIEEQI